MRISFLLIGVVLLLLACAHEQRPPDSAHKDGTAQFDRAESAWKQRQFDRAASHYRKILAQYPSTRFARLSQYRLGSLAYQRKDYRRAAESFRAMLEPVAGPDSDPQEFKIDAEYNLAACEYQLRHYEKAYEVLGKMDLSMIASADSRRAEMAYSLVGRTARKLEDTIGLIAALSAQSQLPLPPASAMRLEQELVTAIASIRRAEDLELLLSGQPGTRVRPIGLVSHPPARERIQEQIRSLTGVADSVLDTDKSLDAAKPVEEAPRIVRVGSGNVGVLLPLSGKFQAVGKRVAESMALASGLFDSKNSGNNLRLFFEDTQSNEDDAILGLERLVNEHNISIVVGPITWKEASVVAKRAQELEVANLSLVPREGITDYGAYIFQNALTPTVQVESLVEYCMVEKGFSRFAILAPNDSFGSDMAFRFWDTVERRGGKIVGYETYPPEDTDFQLPVQKLVGLHLPDKFRRLEVARIAEYQNEQKKKNPKKPEKKIRLQPLVDFDALFIPDGSKAISQIVPNLAYFDVPDLPLLGTAEWATGQLFRRSGKAVVGALFPVALHPESRSPSQYSFLSRYREAFGTLPDLLSGQAFEAMSVVSAALADAKTTSSADIAAAMSGLKNFESPLGDLTFDNKRVANRRLPIFTIDPAGSLVSVSK